MTIINDLFADALHSQMTKRNITVAAFAEQCGVSENTVYKWRRGEAATLESISKAAYVLSVHPAVLLGASRVHPDYAQLWKRRRQPKRPRRAA